MPRTRPSSRIQRRTIVKRTHRLPRVHSIRPVFPVAIIAPNGEVSTARSQSEAIAEAARMLVEQLTAEQKPLTVIANVAAAMAVGVSR